MMDEGQAFIDGIRYAARMLKEDAQNSEEKSANLWLGYAATVLHAEAHHFEKGLDK